MISIAFEAWEGYEQDIDVAKANSFYPQKSGLVTLTLVDYKTDMWSTDDYGPYLVDDIPRPIQEPDHFSEWSGYNDRLHSEFEDYKQKHTEDVMRQMSKLYSDADSFTTSPDFYLKKHIQHDFEKSNECSDITLKIRDRCDYEQKVEFEIQKAQKVMDMIMDNPESLMLFSQKQMQNQKHPCMNLYLLQIESSHK